MYPNFVLLLLINAQQEILLLRRINTPFCNHCYSLPGGTIEYGESARQALVREIKNSLGMDVTADEFTFAHVMHRKCNEPEFFACVFTLVIESRTPCNAEPERHDDMRWYAADALPGNMVPAHRHAIEQIRNGNHYSEHGWR